MKQSLQLKLSQHLALTPQLQQSIRLLQLSTLELNQELEKFLEENPLLEREEPGVPPEVFQAPGVNGEAVNGTEAANGEAPSEAPPAETESPPEAAANEGDWLSQEAGNFGSGARDDDDGEYSQGEAIP